MHARRVASLLLAFLTAVAVVGTTASADASSGAVRLRSSLYPASAEGTVTRVEWSGSGLANDGWIAVFPVDADANGYLADTVRHTAGRPFGIANILAVPAETGSYEHRYYSGQQLLETGTPFELTGVAGAPAAPVSPSATPAPPPTEEAVSVGSFLYQPEPNGTVTKVSWVARSSSGDDWVAVFPVGAGDDAYVDGTRTPTYGRRAGVANIVVAAPTTGQYEHRYYRDGTLAGWSTPFTLNAAEAAAPASPTTTPPAPAPTQPPTTSPTRPPTTSPTQPPPTTAPTGSSDPAPTAGPPSTTGSPAVGDARLTTFLYPSTSAGTITKLTWTAAGAQRDDWVAVFPVGADADSYLDGTRRPTYGHRSGVANILASPETSGRFEHRYYRGDQLLGVGPEVAIGAATNPPESTTTTAPPTPTVPLPDRIETSPDPLEAPPIVDTGTEVPDPNAPGHLFVAPGASGTGSFTDPADLASLIGWGNKVPVGSTIWLRAGTYTGHFVSYLYGTADQPIVVRPYPGEAVVIDGPTAGPEGSALIVWGRHTVFRDLTITNSNRTRVLGIRGSNGRATLINLFGTDIALINNVISDGGNCIGAWSTSTGAVIYGNLIFNCGWDAPDRGHGHGIYIQNDGATKYIESNVIVDTFSYGLHAYSAGGKIRNLDVRDNLISGAGALAGEGGGRGSLIGGGTPITGINYDGNVVIDERPVMFGWNHVDNRGLTLTDNYIVSTASVDAIFFRFWNDVVGRNNTLYTEGLQYRLDTTNVDFDHNRYFGRDFFMRGNLAQWQAAGQDLNSTHQAGPPPDEVIVKPNRYADDRANVAVFSWSGRTQVDLDLSSVLEAGDRFEIRNAQDYFGAPAASGVFDGSTVSVDLSGLQARLATGHNRRAATDANYHSFVVIPV